MTQILIADDEANMRRVLKLYLEREGYAVKACSNGQEALAAALANPPDALVTDIKMPVMNGKELVLALKEKLPQRSFPIFVMTSMTDQEHRDWTAKIARLEFLEKPLSMRALLNCLKKCLSPAQGVRDHD